LVMGSCFFVVVVTSLHQQQQPQKMLPYVLKFPGSKHPVLQSNNAVHLFTSEDVTVLPGEKVLLDLGIRFDLPANICGLVCLHPHIARVYNLHIGNAVLGR
jgi:dUTPase